MLPSPWGHNPGWRCQLNHTDLIWRQQRDEPAYGGRQSPSVQLWAYNVSSCRNDRRDTGSAPGAAPALVGSCGDLLLLVPLYSYETKLTNIISRVIIEKPCSSDT